MSIDNRKCDVCLVCVPKRQGIGVWQLGDCLVHQGECWERLKAFRKDVFERRQWGLLRKEAVGFLRSIASQLDPKFARYVLEWNCSGWSARHVLEVAIFHRDGGYSCHLCGKSLETIDLSPAAAMTWDKRATYQFDHLIPREWGGSNTLDNIKFSHVKCNQRKAVETRGAFKTVFDAHRRGVELWAHGGKLQYQAATPIPPGLLAALRRYEAAVLDLLAQELPWTTGI